MPTLPKSLMPLVVAAVLAGAAAPRAALAQRGEGSGLAEEFGGAGSCIERAKSVERVLSSPRGAFAFGPAADRKDIAYGSQRLQRLDVFLPKRHGSGLAPVIVMVHGGGWCVGDKALAPVTKNKTEHWLPLGFLFVSVDYPMVPDGSDALKQAADVARAVAYVQKHAAEWGGDEKRVVLIGHSAGAHLVSLVNADARLRQQFDVKPLLGVVSLDSGTTNVPVQMRKPMPAVHARYVEAFGTSEAGWIKASPFHQLDASAAPWLGVCSSRRADDSCGQAREYADKSRSLGVKASVLPIDKAHGPINKDLGLPGPYTNEVDDFIASLDPQLRTLLAR